MIILRPCAFVCTHAIMCAHMFFVPTALSGFVSYVFLLFLTCFIHVLLSVPVCYAINCSLTVCVCAMFSCAYQPARDGCHGLEYWLCYFTCLCLCCVFLYYFFCVVFNAINVHGTADEMAESGAFMMDSGDHVKHKNYAYAWSFKIISNTHTPLPSTLQLMYSILALALLTWVFYFMIVFLIAIWATINFTSGNTAIVF